MALFKMTDKQKTKIVPCQHPGCENQCIVTTFFAPAKARCPEHMGIRSLPKIGITQEMLKIDPKDLNKSLYTLACPQHPNIKMDVISTSSKFQSALSLTLQCPKCFLVVQIVDSYKTHLRVRTPGESVFPDWFAFDRAHICKCGHRIAAYATDEEHLRMPKNQRYPEAAMDAPTTPKRKVKR